MLGSMTVTYLQRWDLTAIEIALDLETPPFLDGLSLRFSSQHEPRICLVAGFALSAQLERIVGAIERARPARLPSRLRAALSQSRGEHRCGEHPVAVQPMLPLMRLQSRLIRAIAPGLVYDEVQISLAGPREFDEVARTFIRDFISSETIPTFEPAYAVAGFPATQLWASGITIYQLGPEGTPQSIVRRWAYPQKRTMTTMNVP
jgi:hypothetical protein